MDNMDRLLILDSNNFIGFELKKLFWNQFEIFTLTGDITDPFQVEEIVSTINPQYIIHICNQRDLHNLHEKDNFGVKTYQGTLNVIAAIKKLQNFKLFLFHSIYDKNESLYDFAKLGVEKVLSVSGINYCVLKLPYIFGDFFRTYIFNIGQHIDDTVRLSSKDFDFKPEILIHETKNKRRVIVDIDKFFKFISLNDLIFLYKFLFENIEKHVNKKYTVPYKSEFSIKDLINEIQIDMNGYDIMLEIENEIEKQESIVTTYDVLDWQPLFDLSQSVKILLQKMQYLEKDIYGL